SAGLPLFLVRFAESMNITRKQPHVRGRLVRALMACAVLALASLSVGMDARAQQRYSRSFAPRKNVSLLLKNRSGLVEVQGWDRAEIRVTATLESPAARFTPTLTDDGLIIVVSSDNRGLHDVGAGRLQI